MTIAEKLLRAKADIDQVYEAGKEAADRERFEVLQKGGKATDYSEMFAGASWTNETFKPIYDIKPTNATRMFAFTGIKDLKAVLENQGVVLDFKNIATNGLSQMFSNSKVTDIGLVDVSSQGNLNYLFQDASRLVNVEKVILSTNGNQTFMQAFGYTKELVEIRFEGVIGNNIEFRQSTKLSADSLESIVTHLSDTVTGKTITLPSTARSNYDAVKGEGAWNTLITPITNWTFAYA